jgi:rare lipoprotein A
MPTLTRARRLLAMFLFVGGCCGASATTAAVTRDASPPAVQAVAVAPVPAAPSDEREGTELRGEASYYADFFDGRKTASGERYDPRKMTAANRTLPLGTRVRITRLDTGRSVVVTVNDRGPFGKRRRIFDLSKAAARELDMLKVGKAEIRAVVLRSAKDAQK